MLDIGARSIFNSDHDMFRGQARRRVSQARRSGKKWEIRECWECLFLPRLEELE